MCRSRQSTTRTIDDSNTVCYCQRGNVKKTWTYPNSLVCKTSFTPNCYHEYTIQIIIVPILLYTLESLILISIIQKALDLFERIVLLNVYWPVKEAGVTNVQL